MLVPVQQVLVKQLPPYDLQVGTSQLSPEQVVATRSQHEAPVSC
jgi:hypothetical protein